MDIIQENANIKIYINETEIEVTKSGVQYPSQKIKDDSFIYRYTTINLKQIHNFQLLYDITPILEQKNGTTK